MKKLAIYLYTITAVVILAPISLLIDSFTEGRVVWKEYKDTVDQIWVYGRYWAIFGDRSGHDLEMTRRLVKLNTKMNKGA